MIGAAFAWLARSRFGRGVLFAVAVLASVGAYGARQHRRGRLDVIRERERERAEQVERVRNVERDIGGRGRAGVVERLSRGRF